MLQKDEQLVKKIDEKRSGKYIFPELEDLNVKRPVVFRLLDSMSKLDTHSGKKRGPRSVMIETKYVVDENGEVVEYQYYTSRRRKGSKTETWLEFSPDFVEFSSGKIVCDPKTQLDLIVFLLKHPKRVGGENRTTDVKPIFYLDDPVKKNAEMARDRKLMGQVYQLIYGDQLSEDKLRDMASALMIGEALTLSLPEVQNKVYDVAQKNASKVLKYAKPNKDIQIRTIVGKAEQMGFLKHEPSEQRWMISGDKENFQELCKTSKTDSPVDRLVDFFKRFDENNNFDSLVELVEGEKVEVEA